MSSQIRLQKYLAMCGIASRRKAEEYIAAGRVTIDGRVTTAMGIKVNPDLQQVLFDGKPVKFSEQKVYYLLNKPKGYVTTVADPQGRPIVTDLIKKCKQRIFPVGRLDLDTEGALLLTNDGDLAQKMQHPRFGVKKSYEALVAGRPQQKKLELLKKGILIEEKKTSPADVAVLKKYTKSSLIRIIIHEGRKRQVRKMFAAIDHPIISLKRTAYGKLSLDDLAPGAYRRLNKEDLKNIFKKNSLQTKK